MMPKLKFLGDLGKSIVTYLLLTCWDSSWLH